MELQVKIGADQQKLQESIARMKEQFRNMNTSMGGSFAAAQSANSRYGNIMQSGAPAHGGFDKFQKELAELSPALGSAASGLAHLTAPLAAVAATLGLMGTAIHEIVGAMKQSAMDLRTGRITGMSGMMARRWREAAGAAGVDEGSASMMVSRLNTQVGAFNMGDKTAQGLFGELGINPSEMSVDDLLMAVKQKMGGITDPAKRARLSKGLMGRGAFESTELLSKLEFAGDADTGYGAAMADAAAGVKAMKKKKRVFEEMFEEFFTRAAGAAMTVLGISKRPGELKSGIAGAEEDTHAEKEEKAKSAARVVLETIKLGNKAKKEGGDNGKSPFAFNADSMAQAGLFTGSALLFNPNLTVQRDQLEVLKRIDDNTKRTRSIFQ